MEIILGHLVGDYLLQSDWMALNKKNKGVEGLIPCVVHCAIWTISLGMFTQMFTPFFAMGLFASHFILDRTKLVVWLLNTTKMMPNPVMWKIIIVDNTLHLLAVYALIQIISK